MDIWRPNSGTAIELKYVNRAAAVVHDNEEFQLTDQSAQDTRRYDFCLDIARLEGIIKGGKATDGYGILLTNDHLYWSPPRKTDANDADFVIYEDRVINGILAWSARAGAGTTKGRETPIEIRGRYMAKWREYSNPPGMGYTEFRDLLFPCETSADMNPMGRPLNPGVISSLENGQ